MGLRICPGEQFPGICGENGRQTWAFLAAKTGLFDEQQGI